VTKHASLPPIQRSCLWLAGGLVAFAVYGSLIPFSFVPVSVPDAAAVFARDMGRKWDAPLSDLISNVLLFLPLGFFATGAACAEQTGAVCRRLRPAVVVMMLAMTAVLLECAQVWFPDRTVALSDIVALTAGAGLGAAAWRPAGPGAVRWLWRHLERRTRATATVKLLAIYTGLFALARLAPLDVTIDPQQLGEKYAEGRMVLWFFVRLGPSPVTSLLGAAVWAMPLGALASVGWTRTPQECRRPLAAAVLGLAVVWGLELAQLFVYSRATNITEALAGTLGMLVAVALTSVMARAARRTSLLPPLGAKP
jgi:VanZ family protein